MPKQWVNPSESSTKKCCSVPAPARPKGVPATGRPVAAGGLTILRFEGGKVVERANLFDQLGMMAQIGAIEL